MFPFYRHTDLRFALLLVCGVSLSLGLVTAGPAKHPSSEESDEAGEAWLTWRNGDELKGQLNQSPQKRVSWTSPFFSAPIVVRADQLEGIRFPSTRANGAETQAAFRIFLNNGDKLEGNLVSIDEETLTFDCIAFESPVILQRKVVERILHTDTEQLRLSGPGELTSWTSAGRDRKPTDWFTDLSGAFATHQWSGNLFRKIELPEQVEIAFSAAFPRGKPELEIGLLQESSLGPMLETWDGHLVLTFRTKFVPVMEMAEDTRSLNFRLFWNQATGEVRLCDQAGNLLASLDSAVVKRHISGDKDNENANLARGFSILNRTPEMRLNSLTIHEWDGKPAPVIDLSRPRIILSGEAPIFHTGEIRLKPDSKHFSIGSRKVALGDLRELILSPEESAEPSTEVTRVAWFAGSSVSGDFLRLNETSVTLQPLWSDSPIDLKLQHAKEIRFPEIDTPREPAADHLTSDGLSLYGTARVIPGGKGKHLLGWQPPGADSPIPFTDETKASITRPAHPAVQADLASSIGQARLFLANDEILSGELISIQSDRVNFTSRTTGQMVIKSDLIRAIDIGSAGRVLEGFGDSEWERIEDTEGDVTADKEEATLAGGSFGNPSILLGDIVRFHADWKQPYGSFTLRLFAESANNESASTDIVVAAQGNRLYVGKLRESGAFSFSGEQIETEDNKATFRVNTGPDKVTVFINEKSKPVLTIPIDPERTSGNGLYFKMGGGWPGWNQNPNQITFSKFLVERSPGSVPRRIIDPDSREKALTIPRIHRDDAPTHLLIAPNGDLLRGRLLSGVGNQLRFESKGKTFNVPRQRVSTLVWLREEGDEATEPETNQKEPFRATHRFVLMDGSRLNLAADRVDGSEFVGRSEFLGECRVAIENVRQIDRGPAISATELTSSSVHAYRDWVIKFTPDPNVPGSSDGSQSPLIGKVAPEIKISTLKDDEEFILSSHKGKVVVLDFWATWCGPCIKAMPAVRQVIETVDSEDLVFCAINQAETKTIVSDFLIQRDWSDLPVAFDFNMKVSTAYEVRGIPHTVVIDREGKVAWIHSGYTDEFQNLLFEAIEKCL